MATFVPDSEDKEATKGILETENQVAETQSTSVFDIYDDFNLFPRKAPISTAFLVLLNWVVFLCGLYDQGLALEDVTLSSPISPMNRHLWFYSVDNWPSCQDLRQDYWRLISLQFVHAGLLHIGGNTIAMVSYGFVLECYHEYGSVCVLLIYMSSVALGSLGHAYILPYRSLIGCSGGVYGLVGCCSAIAIMNKDDMNRFLHFVLSCTLLAQVAVDLLSYFFWYNPNMGYYAHLSGYLAGFSLGLAFFLWKKASWKRILSLTGLLIFAAQTIYLSSERVVQWPPQTKCDTQITCCEKMFQLVNDSYTTSEVHKDFYCSGYDLIRRNKSYLW